MNSLFKIRGAITKIVIASTIISTIAVAISAQKVDPMSQGKMYGDPGFRGEPINLNVVNADIREILGYITDQYGINFVIDKSVKDTLVTVKVNDVPWNVALDSILQAQGIGVQVNGNILRVADNGTLATEGELFNAKQKNQLDTSPLVTELVRLNYATAAGALGAGVVVASLAVGVAGALGAGVAGGFGAGVAGALPSALAVGPLGATPFLSASAAGGASSFFSTDCFSSKTFSLPVLVSISTFF